MRQLNQNKFTKNSIEYKNVASPNGEVKAFRTNNGKLQYSTDYENYNDISVDIEALTDYEVQDAVWEELYTTYTLTVSVTNGTYVGNAKIVAERPAEIVVTAEDGYSLPSTITVSGATSSYNSTTGVITLTNATGNTSVTVVCE